MAFGVSNSFKRGTIKTYSRQRLRLENSYDIDRPRKRIRMSATGTVVEESLGFPHRDEPTKGKYVDDAYALPKTSEAPSSSVTAPSSPAAAERALCSSDAFQDDESELSSPPASPPPVPSPKIALRKPTFSFLKRKRPTVDDGSASEPLSDITPNACKIPRVTKKAMKQMQIDLGGETRKKCRTCNMEYIPSVKEDAALHSKYCAMNVGGVDMGKAFLRDDSVRRIQSESLVGSEREMVVMVDRKSASAARNRVRKVLEVVNTELSSADIEDEYLWGALDPEKKVIETRRSGAEGLNKRGDRFKSFLHMVDDKCVGFCLAEKISSAFPVVRSNTEEGPQTKVLITSKSSSISVSTTNDVALLGISRIWISKSYRGRGLAIALLECARRNFFYGIEAPKNLVAFSQPTESGGRLAERWFEAETGWHIYRGDD